MKINRLLEITIILLSRGSSTAKELAERFGVSTRTIYRDVDVLSSAGVPVYCSQGVNGGISLLENYTLQKTMLSDQEGESIMFALKTLQGVRYPEIDTILDKIGSIFKNNAVDLVHIDFSPWSSNLDYYDKLISIKNAVISSKMIEMDYLSSSNIKSHRRIEPMRLIFKGQAWYLWGYCVERQDYRTFRLSRIKNLKVLDISFDRSRKRIEHKSENAANDKIEIMLDIELRFKQEALYRLYDDYDDESIIKNEDGSYTLHVSFPEDDWVYGYILSFGDYVEVIKPHHLRAIIRNKIHNMQAQYNDE